MSGRISKAESWSTVHKAYQNINFSAFDFDSVKRSLLDYVKTYHSENFNDFIENSEFIALVELFAYVSQLLAYRQDMNAHENFIQLAQRKQSVLQLAKYISYNAGRNLAPRGLVKITSIQTTEEVFDTKGNNLANKRIIWNDSNNANWREQFFIVANLILEQQYGSVSPLDRVQVDDVVFELYRLKNKSLQTGVLSYSTVSGGRTFPMELVPIALDENGPYERRPSKGSPFSILYGSDGLGDSSDSTGFFMFTKQGVLNKITKRFDGVTPNQTVVIGQQNINDTDVWVNNIDPDTGLTITTPVVDALGRRLSPKGEWIQVDAANVENVIYNTNLNRNKYEVETLEGDDVRIIFGDGEFADVPNGTFDIWYRTSTAGDAAILQNSVVDRQTSLVYNDSRQKPQTVTFTFSLINSLVNGSKAEDIERIRKIAPSVYYTQDRMVNGRDYNNYLLQDPSIIKLRAINRAFAGESKYLAWHDPSEYYESVKMFGDDLSVYFQTTKRSVDSYNATPLFLIRNVIQPLLSSPGIFITHAIRRLPLPSREFSVAEVGQLDIGMTNTILGEIQRNISDGDFTLYLCYVPVYNGNSSMPTSHTWRTYDVHAAAAAPAIAEWATFIIHYTQSTNRWVVEYFHTDHIVKSPTTKFWFNNGSDKTMVEDTLNAKLDQVVVLKANAGPDGRLLSRNVPINVIGNVYTTAMPTAGLQDINALSVMSPDEDGDGTPDDLCCSELLEEVQETTVNPVSDVYDVIFGAGTMTDVVAGDDQLDVVVNGVVFVAKGSIRGQQFPQSLYTFTELTTGSQIADAGDPVTGIRLHTQGVDPDTEHHVAFNQFMSRRPFNVKVIKRSFAYFYKDNEDDDVWLPATSHNIDALRSSWRTPANRTIVHREVGVNALNFAWFHRSPRYHVIDPSITNIIDIFVVTKGYYNQMRSWLRGNLALRPTSPTAMELRTSYATALQSRMMSDATVMHPGKFKILFGANALPQHRAIFKVIPSYHSTMSSNEIKVRIVEVIRSFFEIDRWEFGETFYFSELAAAVHAELAGEIESFVMVPTQSTGVFGDMYEISPSEDELFIPDVTVEMIEMVDHLNYSVLKSK